MRIVAWNIRAGGGRRIEAIRCQLEAWEPDVVGLCEFRGTAPSLALAESLKEAGFTHQISTASALLPGHNALLLASKAPLRSLHFRLAPAEPGRWLAATVGGECPFIIGLMHLPNMVTGRKLPFMEAVAAIAAHWRRGPAVLLGDTNCGWPGIDEEAPVFGPRTAAWLDGLEAHGWRDAFRYLYGDRRIYTWYSPNKGNGFRLDQAFVNRPMLRRLADVRYEWGSSIASPGRRDALSDHAAILIDFDIPSSCV